MSWSVSFIGKSDKIAAALKGVSENLTGQSKLEFDDAMPNIVGLLNQNFGHENQLLKLNASGSGYAVEGEQKHRQCTITIEPIYGNILI